MVAVACHTSYYAPAPYYAPGSGGRQTSGPVPRPPPLAPAPCPGPVPRPPAPHPGAGTRSVNLFG